jgi:hypothetical protein
MRNSVFLSRRAEKFLAGLRDAKLYLRLRAVIDDLEQNARPYCESGYPALKRWAICNFARTNQRQDNRGQPMEVLNELKPGPDGKLDDGAMIIELKLRARVSLFVLSV